jgi:hypothetical protein
MVSVVAQFIPDKHEDENAHGHSDRQTGNVDEGIAFLSFDVSPGNFKVVFDHFSLLKDLERG